jgi:ribose transport system permease protein
MRRELGMLGALVVVCLIISTSNHDFFGVLNILAVTRWVSMLGILAMGSAFVIITGGIDLSVGSIVGLTGVLIAKISSPADNCLNQPLWIGITVALGVALAIGLVQGLLITRFELQPFIVTLGFMLLIRGVAQVIDEGSTLSLGLSPLCDWFLLNNPVFILLVVTLLCAYLLHLTVFGRYVYAIGSNREAAHYSGIPVNRVETSTYVISAGLAGVSGVCFAAYIKQMTHGVGVAYELQAIAAAVLGGCSLRGGEGNVLGILIGSALMRVIYSGINFFKIVYRDANHVVHEKLLGPNWENVIVGAVILVAVILDQTVHLVQARRRSRGVGMRQ